MTIGVAKFQVNVKKGRGSQPKRPMDVKQGTYEYICQRFLNRTDQWIIFKDL